EEIGDMPDLLPARPIASVDERAFDRGTELRGAGFEGVADEVIGKQAGLNEADAPARRLRCTLQCEIHRQWMRLGMKAEAPGEEDDDLVFCRVESGARFGAALRARREPVGIDAEWNDGKTWPRNRRGAEPRLQELSLSLVHERDGLLRHARRADLRVPFLHRRSELPDDPIHCTTRGDGVRQADDRIGALAD